MTHRLLTQSPFSFLFIYSFEKNQSLVNHRAVIQNYVIDMIINASSHRCSVCVCPRTCPVVTTVVSMARAVRKAFRESYVDRCGPLGVQLCTKYRLYASILYPLYLELLFV